MRTVRAAHHERWSLVRVLVVNHSAAQHLGGSELSILSIVSAWRQHLPELDPHLVSPAPDSALEQAAVAAGWTPHVVAYGDWVSFAERESRARRRLERAAARTQVDALAELIDRVKPALVIVNTVVTPWAAVAAYERGVPVAWFVREFVDDRPGFRLREGREETLRHLHALANRVLANSQSVRASIADVVPADQVHVAHPVVDGDAISAATAHREHLRFHEGTLRIGLVGRVTPEKGHRVAVEALGELRRRGVDAELDMVGGVILPGFDHALRRLARRIGVDDRVHLLGEKRQPLQHLAAADVSLVPSAREAFGRVTLESLALGLPVVASAEGGATELVEHGVSGFLVDMGDPIAIADALERYVDEPRLLEKHGAAARRRADTVITGPHGIASTIAALEATALSGPDRAPSYRRPYPLADAQSLRPGVRIALEFADRASTTVRRLARLLRHPVPPLQRRWWTLSERSRQRARRG